MAPLSTELNRRIYPQRPSCGDYRQSEYTTHTVHTAMNHEQARRRVRQVQPIHPSIPPLFQPHETLSTYAQVGKPDGREGHRRPCSCNQETIRVHKYRHKNIGRNKKKRKQGRKKRALSSTTTKPCILRACHCHRGCGHWQCTVCGHSTPLTGGKKIRSHEDGEKKTRGCKRN